MGYFPFARCIGVSCGLGAVSYTHLDVYKRQVNYRIKTHGQTGHAGTVPMSFRRDALLAATLSLIHI